MVSKAPKKLPENLFGGFGVIVIPQRIETCVSEVRRKPLKRNQSLNQIGTVIRAPARSNEAPEKKDKGAEEMPPRNGQYIDTKSQI